MDITPQMCQSFVDINKASDGRKFYYVDYAVKMVLNGKMISCEFIVPRTGRWACNPKQGRCEHYGENPHRATYELDCAGVFRLYSSGRCV